MPAPPLHRIRIWDLPTRIFHLALLLAVTGLVATGLLGGSAMVWHFRCGQALLALLVFRLLWGIWGGHWSRFSAMWFSPVVLWTYLSGKGGNALRTGHSPMGSLSVLAFLVVLSVQVATGLVSDDAIATTGPLSHLVSNAVVASATAFHTQWGKLMILSLVVLHLSAIVGYSLKGQPLVGAMVHGDKALPEPMPASRDDARSRLLAATFLGLAWAASEWVFSLAPVGM
jgi:cytochrome b